MQFHFTARKFKAHATLREQASDAVKRLPRIYDGIVRGDVVLGYERSANSVKWAEVTIHVHGTVLTATEKSEEFAKSIELAIAKLERRLSKYKSKVRLKDKKTLRKVKESSIAEDHGE